MWSSQQSLHFSILVLQPGCLMYKSGKENRGLFCSLLFPSALLYLWLWSKISCFDLLIWSKQAHGWRSSDDTCEAHVSCPEFRKVPHSAKKKIKKKSHNSSEMFLFASSVRRKSVILPCTGFEAYFHDGSLIVSLTKHMESCWPPWYSLCAYVSCM